MSRLYGFAYTARALAFLKTIPKKFRQQIIAKINKLAAESMPPKSKKLHGVMDGEQPVHRVRSGNYRILYVVRDPVIVVLDIGDRKDVYK